MPSLLPFDELHTLSYELLDKATEGLLKEIVTSFGKLKCRVRRMTPAQVIKESKVLYNDLWKTTKRTYLRICKQICDECDWEWIEDYLAVYDPTYKVIYGNELERKRQRFAESVIASKDGDKQGQVEKAAKELGKMIDQIGIGAVDQAVIDRVKAEGVEYIKWVTEKDERVCAECDEHNGKIYPIDQIPDKHIHCRCHFEPVLNTGQ